jgi:hypothetical protein
MNPRHLLTLIVIGLTASSLTHETQLPGLQGVPVL